MNSNIINKIIINYFFFTLLNINHLFKYDGFVRNLTKNQYFLMRRSSISSKRCL